ncbi:MAG: prepilin peptidase CpaA [Fusobacteria bacterium]|nr:MAG: prepilin peptidase CpaA [Fusobacteriota bacterium]KAF0229759.1 MAG: prepilin peptidase [Fusobacteriota bacterium]
MILNIVVDLVLVILLLLCGFEDIKNKLIPNKYTIPALIAGFVLMTMNYGLDGLKNSFLGFLLGLFIFFLPFIFGLMGAGDVKLMAAIGALKGFAFTVYALFAIGIAGGIMVIIYAIYKKQMLKTIINMFGIILRPLAKMIYLNSSNKFAGKIYNFFEKVKQEHSELYIPYAIPITVGTIGVLVSSIFNLL